MRCLLVVVLGLALVGCGGDDDDSSPAGGSQALTIEAFESSLVDAICSMDCNEVMKTIDKIKCVEVLTGEFDDESFVLLKTGLANGTLVYHPDKGQACLDGVKGNCEADLEDIQACEELVTGTVAENGTCLMDVECLPDLFCSKSKECPGKCLKEADVGEDCSDGECKEGLYCSFDNHTCVILAGENEPCSMGGSCAKDLVCSAEPGSDAGPYTCEVHVPVEKNQGETCNSSGQCVEGLYCGCDYTTAMKCTCLERPESGGPCKATAMELDCPADEYCKHPDNSLEGTCQKQPAEGEPCEDWECGFGLICSSGKTCKPQVRIGQACSDDGECYSDYCKEGVCAADDPCRQEMMPQ